MNGSGVCGRQFYDSIVSVFCAFDCVFRLTFNSSCPCALLVAITILMHVARQLSSWMVWRMRTGGLETRPQMTRRATRSTILRTDCVVCCRPWRLYVCKNIRFSAFLEYPIKIASSSTSTAAPCPLVYFSVALALSTCVVLDEGIVIYIIRY